MKTKIYIQGVPHGVIYNSQKLEIMGMFSEVEIVK